MSTVLLLFALQLLLVSAKTYYDVALNCITNTKILGVTPFADMKVIKKAYYQVNSIPLLHVQLALTMHPDKLKNPTEEDKNRYMDVLLFSLFDV